MKVALYARVSTDDKGQDPETQLRPMREHAAARGWEATEYVDHASADDLRRRKAWGRLLEDARRHRIDHVLVWKLDRAFRSNVHIANTLANLEHWGIGFSAATQPIDTSGPSGKLVTAILGAVAAFERDLISERVRAGMARAKAEGTRSGKPIGRPRRARPVEDHPLWPRMLEAWQAGYLSKAEVARKLGVRYADLVAAFPKGGGSNGHHPELSETVAAVVP